MLTVGLAPSIESSRRLEIAPPYGEIIIAGFEHAMAGHDDHERVAADRLRHRIDCAGCAQGRGNFRIGPGFATRNRARIDIDALAESRNAGHIKRDLGEIARGSAQQGGDAFDCNLDILGRAKFAGIRIELIEPPPRIDLAHFRELYANNACRPHAMPQRPITESKIV